MRIQHGRISQFKRTRGENITEAARRESAYISDTIITMGRKRYISEFPHLMKEWDWKGNADLDPSKITYGSGQKAWWICSKGHKWLSEIRDRISRKINCPYCHGRKVLAGFNDLGTTHPELAKEWDYDKNGSILPTQITAGSNKKFWWKCSKGHEWKTSVACRRNGTGCPYCLNHKIVPGENDFASQHPEFLKEWDYKKNSPLLPTQIGSGSEKKVWWICSKCGKGWQAMVCNRVKCRNLCCRRCNIRESKRNKNSCYLILCRARLCPPGKTSIFPRRREAEQV